MTWEAAIAEYTTELRAANRSPGTIRLHRHYLRHFRKYSPAPWRMSPAALRQALAAPRWGAESRKSARAVAVSFYRWANHMGYIADDPADGLQPVTVPAGRPRPAPETVVARALAIAEPRVRVMLILAAYAGMRCAEISRVHHDDLEVNIVCAGGEEVQVHLLRIHGKGDKVRLVPIVHSELLGALQRADGYLFPGRVDGHLSPGTVTKLLSDTLPDGWTGHTLRHRMATRAYAGTRDLLAVGELLGHSRPETTKRYVQLPPDALLAAVTAAA